MLRAVRSWLPWYIPALALSASLWPLTAADAEQVRSAPARASNGDATTRQDAPDAKRAPSPAPRAHASATSARSRSAVAVGDILDPGEPQTPAAERVMRVLRRLERSVRETRYQHQTVVVEWRGLYAWDCSGMVSWVLEQAAPGALKRIISPRPVARDFVEIMENSPTRTSFKGWSKVPRIEDVRPGDVFAWKRPRSWPRDDETGHVGFVLERAQPAPGHHRAYLLRIADATSVPHQDDSRPADGVGGYGTGTLLVTVDAKGRPVAYGWYGTESRGVVPTHMAFGRVHY
jgi:hypothetical protein